MGEIFSLIGGFFQLIWKWLLVLAVIAFLVSRIGNFLGPSDPLQPADAIIAISGGDTAARAEAAIALYHQGLAPKLIFSGAALDPLSPSNAAVMRKYAVSQGVPDSSVLIDEKARDTTQNALRSLLILHDLHATKVILVTSGYHQRRAAMEFRQVAGSEITVINHPTNDQGWSSHWWLTPNGWWLALSELIKILAIWLRGHLL